MKKHISMYLFGLMALLAIAVVSRFQAPHQGFENGARRAVETALQRVADTLRIGPRRARPQRRDSAGQIGDAAGPIRLDQNVGGCKGEGKKAVSLFYQRHEISPTFQRRPGSFTPKR